MLGVNVNRSKPFLSLFFGFFCSLFFFYRDFTEYCLPAHNTKVLEVNQNSLQFFFFFKQHHMIRGPRRRSVLAGRLHGHNATKCCPPQRCCYSRCRRAHAPTGTASRSGRSRTTCRLALTRTSIRIQCHCESPAPRRRRHARNSASGFRRSSCSRGSPLSCTVLPRRQRTVKVNGRVRSKRLRAIWGVRRLSWSQNALDRQRGPAETVQFDLLLRMSVAGHSEWLLHLYIKAGAGHIHLHLILIRKEKKSGLDYQFSKKSNVS